MVEHQIHFDRKFYKDHESGYWISTDYPRVRAHQWVWICTHGPIPEGMHIHHKDENKSNNDISNLQIMNPSTHRKYHNDINPELRKRLVENCDRVRPLTKKWHASKEGRAWHKYHAIKNNFGNWEPIEYQCQQCRKSYKSKKASNARFCHNKCKSKWRREAGLDNEERICLFCKSPFICNRYSKVKYCSGSCGKTHYHQLKRSTT